MRRADIKDMEQLLYDLFKAYYDARKNKRNTINALDFEVDYETKLFELYGDLKSGKYQIGKSICFISFEPTKREIFAADFRDRIIHHLIFNYINPIFERLFINDSYSCRKNKGTSYGIERLNHFIRSCSENYSKDCYILKLDIKGYFMRIDKALLYQKVEEAVKNSKKFDFSAEFLLPLIYKVIFHNPVENCIIKGSRQNWTGLPKSKSLFFAAKDRGLPIGNLTSQLFGNVYLNDFDHFIKNNLGCKYYSRYVDDFVIVNRDKKYLKSIIPIIGGYLKNNFFLDIHPNKIYLQHFSKGVKFLGTEIKPHRMYVCNRIKGNFYKRIRGWETLLSKRKKILPKDFVEKILCGTNSYLGLMQNFNTYRLRRKMIEREFMPRFENVKITGGWGLNGKFLVSPNYEKIMIK